MRSKSVQAWLLLAATSAAILLVWTVVLPWVGSWQSVRARINFLNERGIDPAALFYTDLEAMPAAEARVARLRHEHPRAFWTIRTTATD